jgi:hypothetical protein
MQSTTEIGRRLHVSRLGTYMAATGDQAKAIALYRWNVELAGAFFETLTLTEVVLRNALDEQLTVWNAQQRDRSSGRRRPAEWTSDPATPLRTLTSHALQQARQAAVVARAGRPVDHPRKNAPITHDDLIAQLTFGVFVKLLPTPDRRRPDFRSREVLWTQALAGAFPHLATSDPHGYTTAGRAERLRTLRNRVAHAEPLLAVNSRQRLRDAARLLNSIDPTTAGWVMSAARVTHVAQQRPN